jgi:RNA polymerase sigma factor (TIGR02999 family)
MGPGISITALLKESREGSREAADLLMPLVYNQLRKLAETYLRQERPGHTLPATALVHEAYLRLAGSDIQWQDRVHFFAVAARQMRRILVDHAKARQREKRGSSPERVTLEESALVAPGPSADLLAVDEALRRLEEFDRRKSEIVELVYFGGLTSDETAEAVGLSAATVNRELKLAKAWLYSHLSA